VKHRLETLPKVELHVHLEGSIPIAALWELVCKYGGDPEVPDRQALERRFVYTDFTHFIDTWVWKNGFLREYEDFERVAEAVARHWAAQRIVYVEAFYSPRDFARHGLTAQRLTESIRRGLDRVPEIRVGLVADLIRDFGADTAARTLADVYEVRDRGVVGVGIGGSEPEYPPEPFAAVFERARELGFRTSAHAGEAVGPRSVWGAIRSLKVDRIGHATRAIEDPCLVAYLAEHQVPLELCPRSNVRTGVIRSLAEHPVRQYIEAGIPVSVNTDDPTMFGTSLADEYAGLMNEAGLSWSEVFVLLKQAVQTAWLTDREKRELLKRLTQADEPFAEGPIT
jgi:adenosine deaminase